MIPILVPLLCLAAAGPVAAEPAAPPPPTGLSAQAEATLDFWIREAMRLVHEGRPGEAALVAEWLIDMAPDDPRPWLVKARVMREAISDQNNVRESLKPQSEEIHWMLDQCIDRSQRILDRDPDSLHGLLYRGWGKMFKAQLHTLAFEWWSAGRAAKAGKKDLDRVLERDPGQGDALMVVGTYEYFADTLPGIMRIASVLLRIPRGNRLLGLALLERAGRSDGYSRADAEGLRGGALFGFDGALETALTLFERLSCEYPTNPRFVEPIGLLGLFFPERLGHDLPLLESTVRAADASPDPEIRNVADRVRLYQALTELFSGRIDEARVNLEILRKKASTQPDWLPSDIHRILVDVHLMLGDRDRALAVLQGLNARQREDRDLAAELRFLENDGGRAAAGKTEVATLRRVQPIARALYEGRLSEAERGLEPLATSSEPFVAFYRGELLTLQGRDEAAIAQYAKLAGSELPERWRLFRYFARLRLAEACARLGDADKAASVLGEALDSYPTRDLLRHVTKARRRWYENGWHHAPES
ncbi:MAG: tetratricopeptide repeat protein [bacterium]